MFKQGDIVAVDFPFTDGDDKKIRPALIISNAHVEHSGDVIILMITSSTSHPNLLIEIDNALLTHPLPKKSYFKCHRVHALHSSLIQHKVSVAMPELIDKVREKIIFLIS